MARGKLEHGMGGSQPNSGRKAGPVKGPVKVLLTLPEGLALLLDKRRGKKARTREILAILQKELTDGAGYANSLDVATAPADRVGATDTDAPRA